MTPALMAAALLDPDPALPHRDALLDASAMASRMPALLAVDDRRIGAVRRLRVKYRAGESLRVLYEVDIDGVPRLVSTRMAPPERADRLAARALAAQRPVPGCPGDAAVGHDLGIGVVAWRYPVDRKIAALPALAAPPPDVARMLGAGWRSNRLVAYAPEKSATARCEAAGGRVLAYAKVYADGADLARALACLTAVGPLRASASVRLPHVLATVPGEAMVVLEALPGTRLDALAPDELPRGLRALARALAALHALPAGGLTPDGPAAVPATRCTPERLHAAGRAVAAVRPDLAGLVGELVDALTERPPYDGTSLLHGDVHLKNALLDGGVLGLIDLDQLCAGHPAADVGSLLASLRAARVAGQLDPGEADSLGTCFRDAYAAASPLDDDALRWHVAAALLTERALRAVTRVLPGPLRTLPDLLREARDLAGGRET